MLPEHSRDRVAPARDDGSSPHHAPWRWAFRIHQDTLVGVAWRGEGGPCSSQALQATGGVAGLESAHLCPSW